MKIGAAPGITPAKWIHRWEQAYPHRPLSCEFFASAGSAQLQRIAQRRIDLGFIRGTESQWQAISTDIFHRVWLYTEDLVVCVSRDHWLAAAEGSVNWADIAEESRIPVGPAEPDPAAERGGPEGEELGAADPAAQGVGAAGEQMGLADAPGGERDALAVAASGAGIVVLPASVARMHSRRDILAIPIADDPGLRVGVCWLREQDSPQIQDFVGITRGRRVGSSRSS